MRSTVIVITLAFFAFFAFVADGAEEFATRVWRSDEGLPHNLVRAIAQTPDGYLWVGTFGGLARFDGMRFTTFDSHNTPALKNSNVNALLVDREGALWIGTYGGGLVRLKDGVFSHFGQEDGLMGDEITSLSLGKNGTLWVGTTEGLNQYSHFKFVHYGTNEGLASEILRSALEDRSGNVWIGTGLGLNRMRGKTMQCFTGTNGLLTKSIHGLLEDKQGRLWIGTDAGMSCYDGTGFSNYSTEQGLSTVFVQTFCEDHRGNLWIGTYSGLTRYKEGKFYEVTSEDKEPFDLILTLFTDREGTVWAGSREGLIRITPKRFSVFSKREGLNQNNVLSVEEDHLGNIWAGTWGGGLNELSDGKVKTFSTKNGFPLDLILCTCEGHDGSLWAEADFDAGMVQMKGRQIKRYTWKDGIRNAAVRVIREDREGNVWVGTSDGLNCLSHGNISTYTVTNSNLAGPIVRDICEDHLGRLWVGTEDGLSLLQGSRFTNFTTSNGLSSSVVLSLVGDSNGDLWIGTYGGGINRLRNGHFTSYDTDQGLFSDDAFAAVEDDSGYFWISCYRGVYRVRKSDFDAFDRHEIKSIESVSYGRVDGLMGLVYNCISQPSCWKCRDGQILFPTTKGMVRINSRFAVNQLPPPVVVEQIVADNQPLDLLSPSPGNGDPARPRGRDGVLEIPPGRGQLEIHYTALSFQLAEKNCFKYRLDGVDTDWVDAGSRRVAYYNNVAPGTHLFRVMACNNDGIWNETATIAPIKLMPHAWQTAWFRVLTALGLAAALAGLVRYVSLRKLSRRLAVLQGQHAIEKERTRIARDIHDDLGARLTQITLLSDHCQTEPAEEARNSARKISSTAREVAQALDEIVWAVNPQHDTLEGLVEYLSHFADDFLEDTTIHAHITLPTDLPRCVIPAETRHQFFLAFKEALHNAVKHSSAHEIQIDLIATPDRFQVVLADNGRGFDPGTARTGGNGMGNMRQRMQRIGGELDFFAEPGGGARVALSVKLQPAAPPLSEGGGSR